ncbi:MAG: hypothetical protein ACRD2H_04605 [Terriglobales bacterium]
MLEKIPFEETPREIELVLVTLAEFGFATCALYDKIYARARTLGLDIVPAEAGPQLWLAYPDQPTEERLLIAMEPITIHNGDLCVFAVKRGWDDLWLTTDRGTGVYGAEGCWVFTRRHRRGRKKAPWAPTSR